MGVSGFVTWTAPMFLLFLQEINSERPRSAAGTLGFSRRHRAKKQRIYSPPWGNLRILTKTQSFAMCPIAMASQLTALGRNRNGLLSHEHPYFVNKLIYIIVFARCAPCRLRSRRIDTKGKSLTR
jgi:hypothetical protein